jgi:hypothetical protein
MRMSLRAANRERTLLAGIELFNAEPLLGGLFGFVAGWTVAGLLPGRGVTPIAHKDLPV